MSGVVAAPGTAHAGQQIRRPAGAVEAIHAPAAEQNEPGRRHQTQAAQGIRGCSGNPREDNRDACNFSASVGANPFRELRDRQGLDGLLNAQFAGPDEPVIVFLHVTTPRLQFLDKGKSSVALP